MKTYEGSKEDLKKDKKMADKLKMPMKKFENSKADKKEDKAGEKKMKMK